MVVLSFLIKNDHQQIHNTSFKALPRFGLPECQYINIYIYIYTICFLRNERDQLSAKVEVPQTQLAEYIKQVHILRIRAGPVWVIFESSTHI